jgi:hypothetical protein
VPRRKGSPSEAPKTLPSWPSLTANLWGLGALNPGGGLNSDAGSVAEESGWALTRTACLGRALGGGAAAGPARRGRRNGARGSGSAAGAMDR